MNLDAYRSPVAMSDAGKQAALLERLPTGPRQLAGIVQGLMIHQHIADAYGVVLSSEQQAAAHLRGVEGMLACLAKGDGGPLDRARPASQRLVGVCRHFTLLHVAMLRRQGVAARARCGFAGYFQPGKFLDHWVTEYWNEEERRWVLFDAQLDARQR